MGWAAFILLTSYFSFAHGCGCKKKPPVIVINPAPGPGAGAGGGAGFAPGIGRNPAEFDPVVITNTPQMYNNLQEMGSFTGQDPINFEVKESANQLKNATSLMQMVGNGTMTLDQLIQVVDQLKAEREATARQALDIKRQQEELDRQRQMLGNNNFGGNIPNYGNAGGNFNQYGNTGGNINQYGNGYNQYGNQQQGYSNYSPNGYGSNGYGPDAGTNQYPAYGNYNQLGNGQPQQQSYVIYGNTNNKAKNKGTQQSQYMVINGKTYLVQNPSALQNNNQQVLGNNQQFLQSGGSGYIGNGK